MTSLCIPTARASAHSAGVVLSPTHVLAALLLAFLLPVIGRAQSTSQPETALTLVVRVSPHPSPYLADWESRRESVILTVINRSTTEIAGRLDAQITHSNRRVAYTNLSTMPQVVFPPGISTFDANSILPSSAVRIDPTLRANVVRSGMLPAGSYELCVKVILNGSTSSGSEATCTPFQIIGYQPPVLILPTDGATIHTDVDRPMFRWTPVTPMPQIPVRYELRIYPVYPGTSPMQSTTNSTPVFQVSTTIPMFPWPVELSTLPGGRYIWSVQTFDNDGQPVRPMLGTPEPFQFTIVDSMQLIVMASSGVIDAGTEITTLSDIVATNNQASEDDWAGPIVKKYYQVYAVARQTGSDHDTAMKKAINDENVRKEWSSAFLARYKSGKLN